MLCFPPSIHLIYGSLFRSLYWALVRACFRFYLDLFLNINIIFHFCERLHLRDLFPSLHAVYNHFQHLFFQLFFLLEKISGLIHLALRVDLVDYQSWIYIFIGVIFNNFFETFNLLFILLKHSLLVLVYLDLQFLSFFQLLQLVLIFFHFLVKLYGYVVVFHLLKCEVTVIQKGILHVFLWTFL